MVELRRGGWILQDFVVHVRESEFYLTHTVGAVGQAQRGQDKPRGGRNFHFKTLPWLQLKNGDRKTRKNRCDRTLKRAAWFPGELPALHSFLGWGAAAALD